jgi:tetratricopeptide (TPR) repeat protein/tRNA A-37 threonylcarbamoyl transferase component Bud32
MESTRIGHYELGPLLGRGGMGEVYEALDLVLGRRVALKFLSAELASDADSLARFEREARSAAALSHPHIATLYAFEQDGDRRFIAMERLSGETLRRRLRHGALATTEALAIARDVADALAFAHAANIVHRDIKPENLMFDARGSVRVTDFGLARAIQAARLTMTGTAAGTAAYMAPEAIRGDIGTPADVFALGVVLHEMLTGDLPFAGENPIAIMHNIVKEPPRLLRDALPGVAPELESLVLRTLDKDPGQRIDSAALAAALASLTGTTLPVRRAVTEELEAVRVPRAGAQEAVDESAPTAMIRPPAPRRFPWLLPLLALPVAIAGALLAITARNAGLRDARRAALAANNRGIAELAAGRIDAAEAAFRESIARDRRYAKPYLNLGMVQLRRGRAAEAESLYLLVLTATRAERSDSANAYAQLASLDMDQGVWTSAVENLARSFALDSSSAAAYGNLGFALVQQRRPAEALAVLERGVQRFPDEPLLHKNAGLAALRLDRAQVAAGHLARAVALDPSLAVAHGLLARADEALGRRSEAGAQWRAYDALAPDSAARAQVGPRAP